MPTVRSPLAACIDIGGTKALLGLVDPAGHILARERFGVAADYRPEELAALLAAKMRVLAERSGCRWADVRGLGYSTTGMLDGRSGMIFTSPNQGGWRDVPFASILSAAFVLPVRIEMDANAAALGEAWLGAGRGADPFALVIVGTGIGAGLMIDGKVLRGWRGTAGEIGHMCIQPDGPDCNCGGRGCLESLASGPAIALRARQALAHGQTSILSQAAAIDAELVFQAARMGDALAQTVVGQTVAYLSIGLTNLIHLLNPEVIALGGGVGAGGADLLLEPLRAAVASRVGPWVDLTGTRIIPAEQGNEAGLLGAARLVWTELEQDQPL
jgi:glucokinase